MRVIDASVACKWLVEEEGSGKAAKLLGAGEGLVAPDLVVAEVASALWKKLQAGQITSSQARAGVAELSSFFDELVPGFRLAPRSLAIAEGLRHSVYDCFYVALAELRNSRLITADLELVRRVRKTRWARIVEVI